MVCVLALVAADNVHSEMLDHILFHHLYKLHTRVGRRLGAYDPASTCPKTLMCVHTTTTYILYIGPRWLCHQK